MLLALLVADAPHRHPRRAQPLPLRGRPLHRPCAAAARKLARRPLPDGARGDRRPRLHHHARPQEPRPVLRGPPRRARRHRAHRTARTRAPGARRRPERRCVPEVAGAARLLRPPDRLRRRRPVGRAAREPRSRSSGEPLADRFRATASLMQGDTDRLVQKTRHAAARDVRRTLASLGIAGALALAIADALLAKLPERLRRLYASEEDARRRAEQGANAARALEHVIRRRVPRRRRRARSASGTRRASRSSASRRDSAVGSRPPRSCRSTTASSTRPTAGPLRAGADRRRRSAGSRPRSASSRAAPCSTVRDATAGYVLERARADFVATASHELRTPLTAVYGGARTLIAHRDPLERGQQDELLAHDRAGVRASRADRRPAARSARSSTAARVHLDVVGLSTVALCSSRRRVRALARADGRTCVMLQMPTSMATLRCDEALLRQVLVNFVENAMKYSPEGGRVDVLVLDDPEPRAHRGRRRGHRHPAGGARSDLREVLPPRRRDEPRRRRLRPRPLHLARDRHCRWAARCPFAPLRTRARRSASCCRATARRPAPRATSGRRHGGLAPRRGPARRPRRGRRRRRAGSSLPAAPRGTPTPRAARAPPRGA